MYPSPPFSCITRFAAYQRNSVPDTLQIADSSE